MNNFLKKIFTFLIETMNTFLKDNFDFWMRMGVFLGLTALSTWSALKWRASGQTANAVLYAICLIAAMSCVFGKNKKQIGTKILSGLWPFLSVLSLSNRISFLGFLLGIIHVILFWHFVTSRKVSDLEPEIPDGTTTNFSEVGSDDRAETVMYFSGSIIWSFFKKDESGLIAKFRPLMWCGIPQPWRYLTFVKEGGTISVVEHKWFHLPNRQMLVECHDPDYSGKSSSWLLGKFFSHAEITLIRHGNKADGKPEKPLCFRLRKRESEKVIGCLNQLTADTCKWLGVKRLGHFTSK